MSARNTAQAQGDSFPAAVGLLAAALVCIAGLKVAAAFVAPALAGIAHLSPAESGLACLAALGAAALTLRRRA